MFEELSQLVQSSLDGYKVSIMSYGQTGSGKTFTMEVLIRFAQCFSGIFGHFSATTLSTPIGSATPQRCRRTHTRLFPPQIHRFTH